MKKLLYILICYFSFHASFACINEYGTLLSGKVVYGDPPYGKVSHRKIDTTELRTKATALLTAYKRSDSLEYLSDYAAALTYLREYQKAKKIYQQIETLSPNLYTTASNLGTIYELIEKPDSALIWIKKAVKINSESHSGSEWIHIKILEFKISGSTDFSKSILGLDFGNESIPTNHNNYKLHNLQTQILFQLRERTTFIQPKNKIVGNIYFDLGNIIAQTNNVQSALQSYEEARKYGFESELMYERINKFEALALLAKPNKFMLHIKDFVREYFAFLFFSGLLIFMTAIFFTIRTIRRKLKMIK